MREQDVFVENLSRLIETSPLTRRQIAEKAGIGYATLNRWLKVGLAKSDSRTRPPLQRLCRVLRVRVDTLWQKHLPRRMDRCLELVTDLINHWESCGCEQLVDELTGRMASCLHAARVVARFRREEPDLTEVVAKVKMLSTEPDLQQYLEGLVCQWDMAEDEAYKRLIESTRRFLCAALPSDPAEMGIWFRQTHPQRWSRLLQQNKVDSEGEACAFVRHMMAEGLSPLEAYEALLRLSNAPVDER